MTGGTSGYFRVNVLSFQNHILIILMGPALFCGYKMSTHLHALCTQHKGCRNASSICDSPCCNHRNAHCIRNLRHQNHCGGLPDMSAGFTAFRHNRICTAAFHSLCVGNGSDYRYDLHTCFLPHFHVLFRVAGTSGNHRNLFLYNNFCNLICVWTHQHNINAKWLVSKLLYLLYLLAYPLSRGTCSTDQAKSASLRNSCCQVVFCHPCHASLNDGIFNSK